MSKKKEPKHEHAWHDAYTNSRNGRKESVRQSCRGCGKFQTIPYIEPETNPTPVIIHGRGFGNGLSR